MRVEVNDLVEHLPIRSLGGDMATRAIFVGVNKHRDPTIPELGGAREYATALWARHQ